MKKKIWSILLSLLIVVTSFVLIPVNAQTSYVNDESNYFSLEHKNKFEDLAQKFYRDYNLNVVVVFCKDGDLIEYASQYYQNNFGNSDGFVIGIKEFGKEKYLNAYGKASQYLQEPLNLDDIFIQYQISDAIQEIIYQLSLKVDQSARSSYIVDKANILTKNQEEKLNVKIQEIISTYKNDVVILTTYFTNNKSSETYLDDYYDSYRNGYKEDGLILGMNMTDRYWHISTAGHSIFTFTDWGIKYLGQEMLPYFKINDYYGGFDTFLDYTDRFFEKDAHGDPYDIHNCDDLPDYEDVDRELYSNSEETTSSIISNEKTLKAFIIALGTGLLMALIVNTGKLNQLKTKKAVNEANNYVKEDSFNLTNSTDLYLYKSVTKRARPKNDDNVKKVSHSSSPRSVSRPSGGSTTHTSSSGRSHGGGGGHF